MQERIRKAARFTVSLEVTDLGKNRFILLILVRMRLERRQFDKLIDGEPRPVLRLFSQQFSFILLIMRRQPLIHVDQFPIDGQVTWDIDRQLVQTRCCFLQSCRRFSGRIIGGNHRVDGHRYGAQHGDSDQCCWEKLQRQ